MRDERLFARQRDALLAAPSFGSVDGLRALAATVAMMPGVNHAVNAAAFQCASILGLKPEDRLIEIGCGGGVLLRSLQGQVGFDTRPTGFDISKRAIAYAQSLTPGGEVEFVQAPATKLPLPDHSVDVALCGHMARFLPDAPMIAFLLEMKRVLKPRGRMLLWEYAPAGGLPGRVNQRLLGAGGQPANLRSYHDFVVLASTIRFGWIELIDMRPFLLPPIPRVTVLLTRSPLEADRADPTLKARLREDPE